MATSSPLNPQPSPNRIDPSIACGFTESSTIPSKDSLVFLNHKCKSYVAPAYIRKRMKVVTKVTARLIKSTGLHTLKILKP